LGWIIIKVDMENKETKKPNRMRKISDALYRKLYRRNSQILRVKAMIREAWRTLKQID
jgi:hypothetical protein